MDPERWQQIDRLLEAALEREATQRAAFLDQACAGDEELRREVESLLNVQTRVDGFLGKPALEEVAQNLARDKHPSLIGRQVGHYQILSRLGEGGMGIVYKARDRQLERHVAIKVLPPHLVADRERKRRFVQEAKAASALNHPNIVTIHEIASDHGVDFIVMEYVAGKTLDQLIPRKGMGLNEALNIAIPMADALAAAHAAGIVHRDLKPGNVMLGDNGQVKVLDFGLAKLIQLEKSQAEDTRTLPESSVPRTEEGMILGTVCYMSPEQAEGKPVDARSDIFSFGSVLYEMVTRQRAFHGDSTLSTRMAILQDDPPPVCSVRKEAPPELERIITKALEKDREVRYQTALDLRADLKRLQRDADSRRSTGASVAEAKPSLASQLKWVTLGPAVISLAVAGWIWFGRSATPQRDAALVPVPLTAYPGWESSPTFSPDGSQVAFEWSKTSRFQDANIYIKQIGVEGNPVQLTDNPAPDQTPAWSPDGRTIAFARILPPDWKRIAYVVKPQRGGSERTIAEFDMPGAPIVPNFEFYKPVKWCAWTADSRSLVVVGKSDPGASAAFFLVSVETREKRRLTDPPPESADFNPAVSPNGRTLAFSRGNASNRADLYLLSLSNEMRPQEEPERLAFDVRLNLFPAWTSDGRELMFVSASTNSNISLWRVAVTNSAQRQRLAFSAPWNPAVARQGNRLAYSTWNVDTNIWRVDVSTFGKEPGQPLKVFSSTFDEGEPAYSPDGRQIAFASGRSGSLEIWVADSDGSNPEKLTSFEGPMTHRPRWSPDGQRIAFYSDASGNRDAYVIRKDGSELKRLTMDPSRDTNPGWSADGKWIYFHSDRRNRHEVWKVPVDGGEAVRVPGVRGSAPMESPDGKFLYYDSEPGVWRVPSRGGAETQVIDSLHREGGGWVALNDGIYFISKPDEKGVFYIRFKDLATGSVRTIAPIERPVGWGLAVSPDRRSFLYSQADNYGSDLMLVENFR